MHVIKDSSDYYYSSHTIISTTTWEKYYCPYFRWENWNSLDNMICQLHAPSPWQEGTLGRWTDDAGQSLPNFWHMHISKVQKKMAHLENKRRQSGTNDHNSAPRIDDLGGSKTYGALLPSTALGTNICDFLFWCISILLAKSHHAWFSVEIIIIIN